MFHLQLSQLSLFPPLFAGSIFNSATLNQTVKDEYIHKGGKVPQQIIDAAVAAASTSPTQAAILTYLMDPRKSPLEPSGVERCSMTQKIKDRRVLTGLSAFSCYLGLMKSDVSTTIQEHLLLTVHYELLTAYCLLLTANCLLLTAYYLLLTASCLLLTTYCLLLTTYCLLLTTYYLLLTTYYLLLTADYLLPTTYCSLHSVASYYHHLISLLSFAAGGHALTLRARGQAR